MPHADISSCRLANDSEGLRQNILRSGPCFQGGFELGGLCLQGLVVELFCLLFEFACFLSDYGIGLYQPLVAGTENLQENSAYFIKHRN